MSRQKLHNPWRLFRNPVLAALLLIGACGGGTAAIDSGPMPEGGSFTGVWFSPQYGRVDMIQNGSAVVGEYKKDERTGKIQGTAQGDLVRFTWEESRALVANRPTVTRGRGYFRYVIDGSSDEHTFLGEWGIDDQESGGGPWNAVKSRKLEPQLSHATSGSDSGGDYGSDNDDYGNDAYGTDAYEGDGDDVLDDLF